MAMKSEYCGIHNFTNRVDQGIHLVLKVLGTTNHFLLWVVLIDWVDWWEHACNRICQWGNGG